MEEALRFAITERGAAMRASSCRPALGLFAAAILIACGPLRAEVLEFEDLFGPCGDYDLVRGPGAVSVQGVLFTSPDIYTYNVGKENSFPPGLGNPFDSDSYHLFTFGSGATIDFPVAVDALRFVTGERTNMSDWPTFNLLVDGSVIATFGANIWAPEVVTVSFPHPSSRAVIQFIQGSSSILGIDSFEYTPTDSGTPGGGSDANRSPANSGPRLELGAPFPNPLVGPERRVCLPIRLSRGAAVRLELFDPAGRRVRSDLRGLRPAGETRVSWDLASLPGGVYRLRASTDEATATRPLVIVR
jgi:hypothetical protein